MIRIFVGCSPNGEDAETCAVLEYTLRKYATQPLDITWMILSRDPASPFYSSGSAGWQTERWPTPFSAFRWAIPHICNFEGRAIYMDSDVIVRDDIAKLWGVEMLPGKAVVAKDPNRFCVSLWDCASAKSFLPAKRLLETREGHVGATTIMRQRPELVQRFSNGNWNCLDLENYRDINDPDIKIIHMTSMPHQPHLRRANSRLAERGWKHWFDGKVTPHWRPELAAMFETLLAEAKTRGFPVSNYDPGITFGPYKKNSLTALVGAKPGWGG